MKLWFYALPSEEYLHSSVLILGVRGVIPTGLFQRKPNKQLRIWNFQGYWRNIKGDFQGLIKNNVKVPVVIKKNWPKKSCGISSVMAKLKKVHFHCLNRHLMHFPAILSLSRLLFFALYFTQALFSIKICFLGEKFKDVHHSYDVWHDAKNLGKKISKVFGNCLTVNS